MALPDTVFGPIPAPLINEWGIPITYLHAASSQTYDPTTGAVTRTTTSTTLKAVLTALSPREVEGLYQSTDLKVYISATDLGLTTYPTTNDSIQYTQAGTTRTASILNITTYRGDTPILHALIARPE